MTQTILDGLTESSCCAGCTADSCVISGQAYCAHPRKGGLHHHQLQADQGAMRRLQTARDMLLRSATELQVARHNT